MASQSGSKQTKAKTPSSRGRWGKIRRWYRKKRKKPVTPSNYSKTARARWRKERSASKKQKYETLMRRRKAGKRGRANIWYREYLKKPLGLSVSPTDYTPKRRKAYWADTGRVKAGKQFYKNVTWTKLGLGFILLGLGTAAIVTLLLHTQNKSRR